MRARGVWAAVCVVTALSVATPSVSRAGDEGDPAKRAEARFFAGQKLYRQQQLHEALAEFRASYEIVSSPNSRLYIARVLRELGQIGEAYDEYTKVINEADEKGKKYAPTRKAAVEEQAAFKDQIATVRLVLPPDTKIKAVQIGTRNVDPARASDAVSVEASAVAVRVEAEGRKPFEWHKDLKAGDNETVQVELAPEAPAAPSDETKPSEPLYIGPMRTTALVSAGVGVAGFVVWGIFGAVASSRFDDLDHRCAGHCTSRDQDEVDAGRRETAVSNVGLVVGIVGVSAGAALWLLGGKPSKDEPTTQGRIGVRVDAGPRASFVMVGGAL